MGLSLHSLLYKRFRGQCIYCLRSIKRGDVSIEHIKPKHLGGDNHKHNLACACKACNSRRGHMSLWEFYQTYLNTTPSQTMSLIREAGGWGKNFEQIFKEV